MPLQVAHFVVCCFIDPNETTSSAELINSIDRRQIRVYQIFYTTLNTPLFRFYTGLPLNFGLLVLYNFGFYM
jgi:hypothetical protein